MTPALTAAEDTVEDFTTGAVAGSLLGSVLGCLAGLGMLAVPGLGFVLAAGTAGITLASILSGAAMGAVTGSLISVLANLLETSKPTTVAPIDNKLDEYLLIVESTNQELALIAGIINQSSTASRVWVY